MLSGRGVSMRLIAGEALGARSPVKTPMAMIYADVSLEPGASVPFDTDYDERGIYTIAGEIDIAGDRFGPRQLLVFKPGDRITVTAASAARLMFLGGEPMDGPRYIWWNFVSSRKERIEQAKADWSVGRFDSVPGETEFIPLPER
jgi:redox-sensitive bicupin YhaK (pirin superfamily)